MIAKAFIAERGKIPRAFFSDMLEKNGIEYHFNKNEDDIISELKEIKPDMIFLQASIIEDCTFDLLERIRRDDDFVNSFIIIHAVRAEGDLFAEKMGADRFLPVPFVKGQMDSILRSILNLPKEILVISKDIGDDSELYQKLFDTGFQISFASSTSDGFTVTSKTFPDLIICDDALGRDAQALCEQIRSSKILDHIQIVVFSENETDNLIESYLQKGAKYVLFKPFASHSNIKTITSVVAPKKQGKKFKALVVDDSFVIRNIISKMFQELGFSVKTAEDGIDGLRAIENVRPDIITSDYDMPGMTGWDFCREVKKSEKTKDIPIVMVTARSSDIDKKKGAMLGVSDYLTKPFKIEILRKIVNNVLDDALKRKEEEAIARYVSSDARKNVAEIVHGLKETESEAKFITICFTDICSFTPKCERHESKVIVKMLNLYFDSMITILSRHHAIVDKFIGDAIVARFDCGSEQQDALNAVRAAHEMLAELRTFDMLIKEKLSIDEKIEIRIGINSGEVILGNLGSAKARLDYTMIGDNVNITQRLESNAPKMGCLISDSTYHLIQDKVIIGETKEYSVKGKAAPVIAHVLVGVIDAITTS